MTWFGDKLVIHDDKSITYVVVVVLSLDFERWLEAMKSKISFIHQNKVWSLIDPPEGVKQIICKRVFKKKIKMEINI